MGLNGASLAKGEWFQFARVKQYPAMLDYPATWLVTGGRGAGKTRLGAEWVNALVRGLPPFTPSTCKYGRFALVGETLGDVRDVMIEGPSGLLTIFAAIPAALRTEPPAAALGQRRPGCHRVHGSLGRPTARLRCQEAQVPS